MQILTIDFETYYSKQFSLSKQTTEEYIRDKRFEVIGVSVKQGDDSATWISGSPKSTHEYLQQYDWDNGIALAHNAMFDMAILNWRFGIRPKRIADTLSMARALHGTEVSGSLASLSKHYKLGEKGTEVLDALGKHRKDFGFDEIEAYGNYCRNDVELTYKLFKKLAAGFPVSELRLIDLTVRMFTEPVLTVDMDLLQSHLLTIREQKEEWLTLANVDRENLMSNPKFAELLENLGVVPPTKISARTGKQTFAFAKSDEEFKELLEHPNTDVQALVGARLGVKSTIEETRTERFINIGKRGAMPIPLRYYAAHTGRWGGDDKVNMQNLPRGSLLKQAMCAPDGYQFVDYDLSQIEARTLAWLAEQDDLVEAFDRGDDVYKIMASAIYDKPISDITKDERFVGKTTILGAGYGMGAKKFKYQLQTFGVDLAEDECERIIDVYRTTYDQISSFWKTCHSGLASMLKDKSADIGRDKVLRIDGRDGIRLPNGLYVKYPNLRKQKDEQSKMDEYVYDSRRGKQVIDNRIYGGKVTENVCQALARIVIGEHLLDVAKRYKVVMTVHDAIGCIVPNAEVEEAVRYIEKCMRKRPAWAPELPLDCEGSYGRSYGDCK